MRPILFLFICLLYTGLAQASDAPAKPAKAAAKEETIIEPPPKDETKPAKKESKASKAAAAEAARLKEEQAADELAVKIAERIAALRQKEEAAAKANARTAPRYAPPIRRPENAGGAPAKPKTDEKSTETTAARSTLQWSYEGESGPLSWGKLNPGYAKCDTGERQSPIDIRDGIKVELDPLNFEYKELPFSVIDTGKTIQVNVVDGNFINVSGRTYALVQFHFHKPAEERVNGKGFEMVAHLVHKDADGKIAVVAVLIERGKAHGIIQKIWNNLPLEKNVSVSALSNIDLNNLLPAGRDYYTYIGSLTTPPCSEGVLWLVMKEPIEASPEQLAIFARLYPMNARPLQKPAGRLIKESN